MGQNLTEKSFRNIFPEAKTVFKGDWTILKLFKSKSFVSHSQPNGIINNLQVTKLYSILPIYEIIAPRGTLNLNVPFLSGWIGVAVNSSGWPEIHNFSKTTQGRPQLLIDNNVKFFIFYKGFFYFLIALVVNFSIVSLLIIFLVFGHSFRDKILCKIL